MLSAPHRLRLNNDFERVFKHGHSYHSPHFMLKTVHNNLNVNRFGFIISNKVEKKAVLRNKLKRRMRYFVNKNMKYIRLMGYDCVFLTKKGSSDLKYEAIQKEMTLLMQRARFL